MINFCHIKERSVQAMLEIINTGAIESGCRLKGDLFNGFEYEGNPVYAKPASELLNGIIKNESEIACEWLYDYMQAQSRSLFTVGAQDA